MKSSIKNLMLASLALFAILGGIVQGNSQTTTALTLDSSLNWIGYMNVFALPADGGSYLSGQTWGTGDLRAFFDATKTNTLTLTPNTNVYNPVDSYWVNPDGSGAKTLDASFYVETTALEGQILTFSGTCLSNTLASSYTSSVYIKEFDGGNNIVNEDVATPVAGESFNLFLVTGSGTHVQYGFETIGPDANPTNLDNLGQVVFAVALPDPQLSSVAGQAVVEGQNATFTVTAAGTTPLYYQWSQVVGGVTNILSNDGKYSGANTNTLTITGVTPADAGTYFVVVTNSVGSGSAGALLAVASLAQAQTNLLVDPSFESGVFDNSGQAGWDNFSGSAFANTNSLYFGSATPVSVLDGTNCVQVYAAGEYNGMFQDRPALPGQVYTANVWFLSPSVDQIAGNNTCFLEVQFRDAGGNILKDYESSTMNPDITPDTWLSFSPPDLIVSPAGTVSVRFQITYHALGSGGSVYVDNADLRLREPSATTSINGSDFQLTFPTVPGPTYQVLYKTNLTDASWTLLTSVVGDGNVHTVPDAIGTTNRFYIVNTQ